MYRSQEKTLTGLKGSWVFTEHSASCIEISRERLKIGAKKRGNLTSSLKKWRITKKTLPVTNTDQGKDFKSQGKVGGKEDYGIGREGRRKTGKREELGAAMVYLILSNFKNLTLWKGQLPVDVGK